MNELTPDNFGSTFLVSNPMLIYKQCIEDFQKLIPPKQFIELVHSFNEGVENYQLIETSNIGSQTQYVWIDNRKEKSIGVVFDSANHIHRLLLKPYATYPQSDQDYTRNRYSFPIKEDWFVFWGGKNEFVNYHYVYESQRYAYDLVMMKDEKTYKDNQMRNENYYAFNKEIVAPADGTVVKVVHHVVDNTPGEMDELEPAGNYVVLKHSNQEYSLIAHLKQSSIVVKEGETVELGQIIGVCGNSGNSSEPHIHFQVMDSPDYKNCKSICIRFNDEKEPIQGDIVTFSAQDDKRDAPALGKIEKVDIAFSLTEILLVIPRMIGSLFKY